MEVIAHRQAQLGVLNRLLPASQAAVSALHDLAQHSSDPDWKETLISYWQQQMRSMIEIENKIREFGGSVPSGESVTSSSSSSPWSNPFIEKDKILLLNAVNCCMQVASLYEEIRRTPLAYNVRMMLSLHHAQIQDILKGLNRSCLMHRTHFFDTLNHPVGASGV